MSVRLMIRSNVMPITISAVLIIIYLVMSMTAPALIDHLHAGNISIPGARIITDKLSQSPISYTKGIVNGVMNILLFTVIWTVIFMFCRIFLRTRVGRTSGGENDFGTGRDRLWVAANMVVVLLVIYNFVVASGDTYLSVMTHDTFIFIDGIHRLNSGQVGNVDFHSPLGIAVYAIPYWAFLANGAYSGSLELASLVVSIVLGGVLFAFLIGRCTILTSIWAIIFVSLMVAVPYFPGGRTTEITHAMFYNRWGWAALFIIFILYIPLQNRSRFRLLFEGLMAGCVIAFLLFLKISYFFFAVLFMCLLLFRSRYERMLASIAALTVVSIWLLVEYSLGITGSYLHDISVTAGASSEGFVGRLIRAIKLSYFDIVLFSFACIIILYSVRVTALDIAFALFLLFVGVVIQSQNSDTYNIFVLGVVFVWGSSVLARLESGNNNCVNSEFRAIKSSHFLLLLFLIFSTPVVYHSVLVFSKLTAKLANKESLSRIDGIRGIYVDENVFAIDKIGSNVDFRSIFYELRERPPRQLISQSEYVATINDGTALLNSVNAAGPVLAMDFISPFNFILNIKPASGDCSLHDAGRTFSQNSHELADDVLREVSYIMDPVFPVGLETQKEMWNIYGGYIKENFTAISQSKYWVLYARSASKHIATRASSGE
ncbi:MAG: hypothetical protein HC900_03335 [Methylacidiphilales bacterium]|nr:hypothetical protein [Candidatus Methylacidiphilales bacterium]